eukprot:EC716670.1.p1 GENE.EC716670.1~~EC716670.1.p1  ORF type:complete len:141 (+),score=36.63 EC716670.1:118-540(+)
MVLPKAPLHGMKKWLQEYEHAHPSADDLQTEIDQFMAHFDSERKRKEKEALALQDQPDEDGFVTVQRRVNRRNVAHAGDITATAAAASTLKPKKEKVLTNFYAFQQREQKVKELTKLRRQFEEDKERIARMRESRRFRPY